jgi:uncharacterized protein
MIQAFRRGVRFHCTECGECCKRLTADLPLSHADVRRISAHLRVSVRAFVTRYCRHRVEVVRHGGTVTRVPSISLRAPASGRCAFLDDAGRCGIQAVKPLVCAHSPFVGYVAEGAPSVWARARAYCPGVGVGRRWSRRAIEGLLRRERKLEDDDIREAAAHHGDLEAVFATKLPPPLITEIHLRTR